MSEENSFKFDSSLLEEKTIKLEDILVDPNNPRLMEVGYNEVPEKRIGEDEVQKATISKMIEIGLKDIMEKVKVIGFLTIDRVVVRPINGKFLVIEGNRRISSLKVLFEENKLAHIQLSETVLKSIKEFQVLIYNGDDTDIAWLLQGLRHIKGIKEWGPLAQGKYLTELQNRRNLKPTDLAAMTGLGRTLVSTLIRSYNAWQYAKDDEDYGDKVDAEKFSLFPEAIFGKQTIKDWLKWNDNSKKFDNQENFKKLLGWYLGNENENDGKPRLLRVNPDIRDIFSRLLIPENKPIFSEFENGDITIEQARAKLDEGKYQKNVEETKVDLNAQLTNLDRIITAIQTIPIPKILEDKEKIESFINKLENIENAAKTQKAIMKTMKDKGGIQNSN